ncbi:hypothetical protein [Roseivirga sp.]|uniref:hypothetical protein n=1 Tax=Roseivirga sp. TaxID=1964215 RepID=UPI003B8D749C
MRNSSKKIQRVIDQSLSDIKNFKILYDQKSLRLESQVPAYTDLFVVFILAPPITLLINETDLWSLMISFLWFIINSFFYLRIINSFNVIDLNSDDKTIKVDYNHKILRWLRDTSKINFDEVKAIKVDSMTTGKYMSMSYFISIESTRKKFNTVIINDQFKVKRLKFILDEFIRSSDN